MAAPSNNRPSKMKMWIGVAVAVLVVIGVAGWCWNSTMGHDEGDVKGGQFQAIFLTNGQVYFGKLKHVDSKYVTLSDIFYLQVQQQVQPANNGSGTPTATSSTSSNSNSQVSLAKLGNELHGPEDNMFIARDQVLFWENLKDSGKVVQAINSYQQQQK